MNLHQCFYMGQLLNRTVFTPHQTQQVATTFFSQHDQKGSWLERTNSWFAMTQVHGVKIISKLVDFLLKRSWPPCPYCTPHPSVSSQSSAEAPVLRTTRHGWKYFAKIFSRNNMHIMRSIYTAAYIIASYMYIMMVNIMVNHSYSWWWSIMRVDNQNHVLD